MKHVLKGAYVMLWLTGAMMLANGIIHDVMRVECGFPRFIRVLVVAVMGLGACAEAIKDFLQIYIDRGEEKLAELNRQ